jgi:uncharacterized repeat protein (TIGR01451 family)
VGSEWSSTSIDITPVGARKFLGQFGNQTVSLSLNDLPNHTALTISFDLFIIRTWDGNQILHPTGSGTPGPDEWELNVVGGPVLLHTTFTNIDQDPPFNFRQAYPDNYPGGDHPARTGAIEVNTLGFDSSYTGHPDANDSVYHLVFIFPHSASSIVLNFAGIGLQPVFDESWGLDNVQVSVSNGLVAHYKFDEGSGTTALDSSGNGNTGTILRQAGYASSPVAGGGYALKQLVTPPDHSCSSNDCGYVRVEDSATLNFGTGDFTLEAWFNLSPQNFNHAITAKRGGAPSYATNLTSCDGATPPFDRLYLEVGGQDPYAERPFACGNSHVSYNEWHHFAAIRRGSTLEVWLDGVLDGLKDNIPVLDVNNNLSLCIGCGGNEATPAGFFNGLLDEIKLWNRALSGAEVLAECQASAPQGHVCAPTTTGTIVFKKITNPSPDPTNTCFNFTAGGGLSPTNFCLKNSEMQTFADVLSGSGYSISETVPSGWDLASATCDDGSSVNSISVSAGEIVTCTFTNTKRGAIIVEKQTNPDGAQGSFTFTGTASGTISDDQTITVNNLVPGTYTTTENDPLPAFELASISCDDTNSTGNLSTRTATFNVEAGETVKCTFTNTGKPVINATKEASNAITGSLTVFEAGNTIKYTVVLTNTGGATLNDEAGPEFTDTISDLLLMPNAGATATSGLITYNHSTRTYSWNGSIPPGTSVTLTFFVRTLTRLEGTRRFCNQGTAKDGAGGTVLTIDLTPLPGAPGTQTCVDVVGRSDIGFPLTLKGIEALLVGDAMHFMALGTGIEKINVQIFSLTGKRVHTSGWIANGHEWRLEDSAGRKLANGVYLYVMSVRGYDEKSVKIHVKKLIIGR